MTGIAGHGAVPIEVICVDGEHHFHHFSGGGLRLLIVLLKGIADVTEIALYSERGGDELHGRKHLIGWYPFQNLNVLENFFGFFGRGTCTCAGLRLCFSSGNAECKNQEKSRADSKELLSHLV